MDPGRTREILSLGCLGDSHPAQVCGSPGSKTGQTHNDTTEPQVSGVQAAGLTGLVERMRV